MFYDLKSKNSRISVGDTVMMYFPSMHLDKAYKICRPFRGPYTVEKVFLNGVEVRSIETQVIRVVLD